MQLDARKLSPTGRTYVRVCEFVTRERAGARGFETGSFPEKELNRKER